MLLRQQGLPAGEVLQHQGLPAEEEEQQGLQVQHQGSLVADQEQQQEQQGLPGAGQHSSQGFTQGLRLGLQWWWGLAAVGVEEGITECLTLTLTLILVTLKMV